jgi:TIR domain
MKLRTLERSASVLGPPSQPRQPGRLAVKTQSHSPKRDPRKAVSCVTADLAVDPGVQLVSTVRPLRGRAGCASVVAATTQRAGWTDRQSMKRTSLKSPRRHNTNAFISYSHADRVFGGQAKKVLDAFGFESFLAHDDLELSAEWRNRILHELARCDLLVALLSSGFMSSQWTSQEIGFVLSREEVVIAPLSLDGTMPYGFISHLQGRRVPHDGITSEVLIEPLARKLPRQILPFMIYNAAEAQDFRSAEERIRRLRPLFDIFEPPEAQNLALAAVENGQIWFAKDCHEDLLPDFIRKQGHNIDPATLQALKYQIEHLEWYQGNRIS